MSLMIILIGVSGAGKSTLRDYLCYRSNLNLKKLIAVTDRPPREGEINAVDKFFLSTSEFQHQEQKGYLCLINEVYGQRYAFFKKDFENTNNYVGELYFRDYCKFTEYHSNSISIYVRPTNVDYAKRGIMNRGASSIEIIQRMEKIIQENEKLEQQSKIGVFDYVFTNRFDDLSKYEFVQLIYSILQDSGYNG